MKYLLLSVGLVAAAAIGILVFHQWEQRRAVLDVAHGAYPPPAVPEAKVYATLEHTPLMVDGRLRVFAVDDRVWAEPLAAPSVTAAYWSYRRGARSVHAVVKFDASRSGDPVVIAEWDDGLITAIDARTGRIRWQHTIAHPHLHLRSGEAVQLLSDRYQDLFTARPAGREVVIVVNFQVPDSEQDERQHAADRWVRAYEPRSGRLLWSHPADNPAAGDCLSDVSGYFTTSTTFVYWDACADPPAIRALDAATGRPRAGWQPPAGKPNPPRNYIGAPTWLLHSHACRAAHSECAYFDALFDDPSGGGQQGAPAYSGLLRITADGQIQSLPGTRRNLPVVAATSTVDICPSPALGRGVAGYVPASERVRWRLRDRDLATSVPDSAGPNGLMVDAEADAVIVLTPDRRFLASYDATSGRRRGSQVRLPEAGDGLVGAGAGFVLVVPDQGRGIILAGT